MSNEFQWTDSMVQEFCNWFCRIPAHEVYKKDRIAEFKASKQPQEWVTEKEIVDAWLSKKKYEELKQPQYPTSAPAASSPSSKRNWEIVAMKTQWGQILTKKDITNDGWEKYVSEQLKTSVLHCIHSVRRLSDGVVFSVGDEVVFGSGRFDKFKIDRFYEDNDIMWVSSNDDSAEASGYSFEYLSKPSPSSEQPAQVKTVCYCGSLRVAMEAFKKAEYEAVLRGEVALLPCCMFVDIQREYGAESDYKAKADELHKRKIDMCDEVMVLNVGGYIGESTRNEIEYANKIGKPIKYLEPPKSEQPKKERIEVQKIVAQPFNFGENVIAIWTTKEISQDKSPAIKEAIEQVLNDEPVWLSGKDYFFKNFFTAAQLEEAERKAWEAARADSKRYPNFQDYKKANKNNQQ